MRLLIALATALMTASGVLPQQAWAQQALAQKGSAQQAMTASQLMASGFEIRTSYIVDKGASVIVLEKGVEAYLCSPVQGDALLRFELAPAGKEVKPLPPVPTVCAQLK